MNNGSDLERGPQPTSGPWRVLAWWMTPLTVAAFALTVCLASPYSVLVLAAAIPLVAVQISLANFAFVFSPGAFPRRGAWLLIWTVTNSIAVQAGAVLSRRLAGESPRLVEDVCNGHPWAIVPLLLIASQIPLWVVRFLEGWQLLRRDHDPEPALVDRTIGLGDLLLFVGIVSVLLASERLLTTGGAMLSLLAGFIGGGALLGVTFPLAILFLERAGTQMAWYAALIFYPVAGLFPALFMLPYLLHASEFGMRPLPLEMRPLLFVGIVGVPYLLTLTLAGAYSHLRREGWRLERVYGTARNLRK